MSKIKVQNKITATKKPEIQKKINPKVYESLDNYSKLKQQLYEHFFQNKPLNISNVKYASAYSEPYNLMNDSNFILTNEKQQYENIQTSFFNIYKQDLTVFAKKIYEQICQGKGLKIEEQIKWITKWINTYTRFNHWIFKTFMIIQRNAMKVQGINLYFEGIKILKTELIEKIYDELFKAVFQNLQLYKGGFLTSIEPLQIIIKYIGIVGFTKYKMVELVKTPDDRFEYQSKKQDGEQMPENAYDTGYFKLNFISRLTKDLKAKYIDIVNGMMQLSTPQYFEKAKKFIESEEDAADHFYGHKSVKETVIRNVLQTVIVERAQGLLKNPKSGLGKMMKEKDITNLVKIYDLLKKANMVRIFFKQLQNYIKIEGQEILAKITPEDQKAMKKETILYVFGEIVQFNQLIDSIRLGIDHNDAQLQKAQNAGFQDFCNTGNKVCNFLAYYADLNLKKQLVGNSNSQQIVNQVGKISKYLFSYDHFMKMHQKLLGLRILYDNFKNQEAEYALIGMLKNQAGQGATSKISCMITDQKSSESWNNEFQLKNKFTFTFEVMMLTSGSWQINDPKCGKTLVPTQLLYAVEEYQKKFIQKMPNRSISWIFTHGRAIVQYYPNSGVKYILVLNNYQLQTVLLFQKNGYKGIKYGDLLNVLKIQDEPFYKSSLMSLLKNGVLVKQGQSGKIQSKNQQLLFNLDFKNKSPRVVCSITPKYTQKNSNTAGQVSAQRSILIDAALVKVMKQRRRAPYGQVILQVQNMCKTFKAQISGIKLRIQNCQQRDFIERDPNDMNILIYKP